MSNQTVTLTDLELASLVSFTARNLTGLSIPTEGPLAHLGGAFEKLVLAINTLDECRRAALREAGHVLTV